MYTLIAFATQWGSKHGGINSFNADFLTSFGAAYHHSVEIICVVTDHAPEASEEALKAHVRLVELPYVPSNKSFDSSVGALSVDLLTKAGIGVDPERTVWMGHDLITGEAAVSAAKVGGGRSAAIHHMSYSAYESYAADSDSAFRKAKMQTAIFKEADLVLAIGPLLRDAASYLVGASKQIHMVVPGLPEIDPKEAPKTFIAFLSGRLSPDAARIKQGHLGIAAFATAESRAHIDGIPEALKRQPTLLLRGVDFENRVSEGAISEGQDPETELKDFTEEYAKGVINLYVLPYTENREQLYSELSGASVALMPSWHEGFGLVAWEAIAAGVPLIVNQHTGVYRLLEEDLSGAQTGYVYPLDVRGQRQPPYFRPEDLEATVTALNSVAMNPAKARIRAVMLRNMLLEKYAWISCSESVAKAFNWDLQKGSVPDRTVDVVQEITQHSRNITAVNDIEIGPLTIPRGRWKSKAGMAESQLLRAEEAVLPFDLRRQPAVDELQNWAADTRWPITVRLMTGEGGQGKSRLAIHICQQLRRKGWHSGFLDSNLEKDRMPALWHELRTLDQPMFVVVDYAETRQEAFLALLKAALQNEAEKPMRMLLLARDGGEWWDTLPSTDQACESLLIGPATTGPFRLKPLYAEQHDREHAFNNALTVFAEILGVERPDIRLELLGDQFQRPLFVQMAALLALYGERPTTGQGLIKALLNHERRYWVGLLASLNWPDSGRRAEQLLALATLAGGFETHRVAETFWTAAQRTDLPTGEFKLMFRKLATLYPGTQGLQALRPDLLGETLVAQALLRSDGESLLDAVLGSTASRTVRRNALTVLARLSNERMDVDEVLTAALSRQLNTITAALSKRFNESASDLVDVSTETVSRLPKLAEMAFEQLPSPMKNQVAGSLSLSLPDKSVQLAGLSCLVFSHLAEKARHRLGKKPGNLERMYEYGIALQRYGNSLLGNRRLDEALESTQMALQIQRKLFAQSPNRYGLNYAGCLDLYAVCLAAKGQVHRALVHDREAIQIYQRLQKTTNITFEYARLLDNYAAHLGWAEEHQEALVNNELALGMYRELMVSNREHFEASYVHSLTNYADSLSNVGKYEQAVDRSREAISIRRRLSQKNPDRFEPDYAWSLINCALYLINMGHNDEAVPYAREAYEIRKKLVQREPKRFGDAYLFSGFFIRLLDWLRQSRGVVTEDLSAGVMTAIPRDEQVMLRLYQAFVEACSETQRDRQTRKFRVVISMWRDLSQRYRYLAKPYYLCATAWCAKFDSFTELGWQTDWQRYLATRNEKVPAWMLEVSQRLKFELPAKVN